MKMIWFKVCTVVKFERDAQTISLIRLFLDMMVASPRKLIAEALKEEALSQEAKGVADLKHSRAWPP